MHGQNLLIVCERCKYKKGDDEGMNESDDPRQHIVVQERNLGCVFDFLCPVYRKDIPKMQFKRPSVRNRLAAPTLIRKISPSAHGFVADMARKLNSRDRPNEHVTEWTPPAEFRHIASFLPEDEAAMLIARFESWYEAHPSPVIVTVQKPVMDMDPVLALHLKYPNRRPPLDDTIKAWRMAGMSESRLNKYRVWYTMMEATSADRQKELDCVFAKYPSASKPVPKIKKVIKAVNKKKA